MQNIISANSKSKTMSSREIAVLVEKRHDNVKRTIELLVEKSIISSPQIEDGEKSANGVVEKLYLLYKRDSLIVVAQLCPEYLARVVDRWQELEGQLSNGSLNPANLTRIQLLQMAMEAEQERLVLEEKVAKIQPMADALIRIAHSDGGKCLMDAAKVLQQRPRAFIADLCVRGWIFRRAGVTNWIGYQDKINALYLEHKLTSVERPDGSTKNYSQVLVTPRGIAKLAMIYGVEPITEAV